MRRMFSLECKEKKPLFNILLNTNPHLITSQNGNVSHSKDICVNTMSRLSKREDYCRKVAQTGVGKEKKINFNIYYEYVHEYF